MRFSIDTTFLKLTRPNGCVAAAAAAAAANATERLAEKIAPGRRAAAAARDEAEALWARMMAGASAAAAPGGAGAAGGGPAEETVEVSFTLRVEEQDAPAEDVRAVTVYGDAPPLRLASVRRCPHLAPVHLPHASPILSQSRGCNNVQLAVRIIHWGSLRIESFGDPSESSQSTLLCSPHREDAGPSPIPPQRRQGGGSRGLVFCPVIPRRSRFEDKRGHAL
jgi:hypothetical protein